MFAVFAIPDQSYSNFENDTINLCTHVGEGGAFVRKQDTMKLSVNEMKLTGF